MGADRSENPTPPLSLRRHHIEVRRIILKILLWSLAAAAVAGVIAVLVGDNDIVQRAMGTLIMAAIAAGIALPTTFMLDREKTRPAGLFAMVFITIEFLLTLAFIWADNAFWGQYDDEIITTIFGLLATGLAAFGFLNLIRRSPIWRIPIWVGLGACALMEMCFLAASWIQSGWRIESNWWVTGWTIGGFGLVMAISILNLRFKEWRGAWRWLGVAAGFMAIVFGVTGVWYGHNEWRAFTLAGTSGVFIALLNLLLTVSLKPGQGWVRLVTMASAGGGAVVINVIVFFEHQISGDMEELFFRLLAASGVVTACGIMAMVVLLAINRRTKVDGKIADLDEVDITIICPRCQRKQGLPAGESSCASCGLRFDIRIEEPTCGECGYLLARINSDRCPECGTPIRQPAMGTVGGSG